MICPKSHTTVQATDVLSTQDLRCPGCGRVLLRQPYPQPEATPLHNLPARQVVSRETKKEIKS